jgi:hypothetical protein
LADPAKAAAILADCSITATISFGQSGMPTTPKTMVAMAASSCYVVGSNFWFDIGEVTPVWSLREHVTFNWDSCSRVEYTSETCTPWGVLWSVSWSWCGGYPDNWKWNAWQNTDAGSNFTASFLVKDFPITQGHGLRGWYDPANNSYGSSDW